MVPAQDSSPSAKMANSHLREGDVECPDETNPSASGPRVQVTDVEVEKQSEAAVEMDSEIEGEISSAATQKRHRGAADKHKFNTLGYQKMQKAMINDFVTVRRANVKNRPALMQVFFNQGLSDRAPTLGEHFLLDTFKSTLESFPLPAPSDNQTDVAGSMAGVPLEDSWINIVQSHQAMDKSARHQQEALWELLYTELNYISKLTVVTDIVMGALTHLHRNGFLQEMTHEYLFSNLPSVLDAHRRFWEEVMLPMLLEARRTGGPFKPLMLEEGFLQFSQRFSSYLCYCRDEENIMEFAQRQMDNPLFHAYIKWVENCPGCGRMRLGDMQAKPHQRITKYPLLLREVLKCTQDPQTQYALRKMLSSVNGFLDSINDHLRLKDEELALSLSATRLEGYDAPEGITEEIEKFVRELCHFDLTSRIRGAGTKDIRKLLLEETLRIKSKPMVVLLFSDVLLLTKAQRRSEKLKVVRPPLALDRIVCAPLKDDVSFVLVEVGELFCAVNVYTVTAPSTESRSGWVKSILAAQESLAAMRERETSQRFGGFLLTDIRMETQVSPNLAEPSDTVREGQDKELNLTGVEHTLLSDQEEMRHGQPQNGVLPLPETEEGSISQRQQQAWGLQLIGSQPFHTLVHGSVTSKIINSRHSVSNITLTEEEGDKNNDCNEVESSEIILIGSREKRVVEGHSEDSHSSFSHGDSSEIHSNVNTLTLFDVESDVDTSKEMQVKNNDFESEDLYKASGMDSRVSVPEHDMSTGTMTFSRKLNSPRLRKRRALGSPHYFLPQTYKIGYLHHDTDVLASSGNSSDSDCNQKLRNSQRPIPQVVISLASVRKNQAMLWSTVASSEPVKTQDFLTAELPCKRTGLNTQKQPRLRRSSVPDMNLQEGQTLGLRPSLSESSFPLFSQAKMYGTSPENLLARARERERGKERRLGKSEKVWDISPSPSRSTSPSISFSEEEREKEDNLYIFGDQENDGQHKWQDVNKELEDKQKYNNEYKYSFSDQGASVDWTGWCFDDDEVMVRLDPEGNGSRPGIAVPATIDSRGTMEQEEQEFGEL